MATVSTQRIFILFVLINLAVGVADITYFNPTAYSTAPFSKLTDTGDRYSIEWDDENTMWKSTNPDAIPNEEATITNSQKTGFMITRFIATSFIPFSIMPQSDMSITEQVLATMIAIFRIFIGFLAGLEMYLLFKNRKAT